ncbi:D-erythronate dehydrogenase [Eumeta japonica]|uniref:D-erythronate dehydrogenase n=1 Tax=Eumeta variegata TaxID=151549 RepID=A0A4C1U1S1_EUMVA|nr:D-erythronate dehydrogenase [Eumeta japonica]
MAYSLPIALLPHTSPPLPSSPLASPSVHSSSIKYLIPTLKTGNALVTLLGLRVTMDDSDHLCFTLPELSATKHYQTYPYVQEYQLNVLDRRVCARVHDFRQACHRRSLCKNRAGCLRCPTISSAQAPFIVAAANVTSVVGGAGFLGQKLAAALLETTKFCFDKLVLIDVNQPVPPKNDPRVVCLALDLTNFEALDKVLDKECEIIFHLAAIVSGHAESDFDLGVRVNFDATRQILEIIRKKMLTTRLVFTSTVGVFGGNLPEVVTDYTYVTPQNSYGMAKAMCKLLINDYSRRGYVDGRVVRLPTVSVRAGTANKAVTSFASGIIREPLKGEESVCPVSPKLSLWLTSPYVLIQNIIHAATLTTGSLGPWRVVNLPGITVTVDEMISALRKVAGDEVASLIRFEEDEAIKEIVNSFPSKFDNGRALNLGFVVDANYEDVIRGYIRYDLKKI